MTEPINRVPAEIRWEIATKGLTGACSAYGNALKSAEGEEKYNDFIKVLWYEAGKGAKEFADNLELKTEKAADVDGVINLLATTSMVPCSGREVWATPRRGSVLAKQACG